MKLKLNLEDKILKLQRWIEKIKENREVFIIIVMFILLCFIVYLSEVLDISHFLLGTSPTSFNWRKALFLIISIIFFHRYNYSFCQRGQKRKRNFTEKPAGIYQSIYE